MLATSGMDEIGFGRPFLSFMFACRKQVRAPQQIEICLRVIQCYLVDNVVNTNHLAAL